MIEVFKTDVRAASKASKLVTMLMRHFPGSKINFDLQDCDKILRVEGYNFQAEKIVVLIREKGFECKVLE